MTQEEVKVLGWGGIISIMVVVAVGFGLLFGILGEMGVPTGNSAAGIGGATGFIGVVLINRRAQQLKQLEEEKKG